MNQLIQVPFEGDILYATKTGNSEDDVFVSVKRVCEILHVSEKVQLRKLADWAWSATVSKMVAVAQDGKSREMTMISLRSLTLWLATISLKRVRPDVASKLAKYQKECRDVLYRHFFGVKEEKRLDIAAAAEFHDWPASQMPNAGLAQRLQKASELVEKYDRLQTLQNRIAAKRISIVIRLKEFGISLSHC